MRGRRQERGAVLAKIRQGWGEVGVEADDAASVAPLHNNALGLGLDGLWVVGSAHRVFLLPIVVCAANGVSPPSRIPRCPMRDSGSQAGGGVSALLPGTPA
jgi:hypothetical protein